MSSKSFEESTAELSRDELSLGVRVLEVFCEQSRIVCNRAAVEQSLASTSRAIGGGDTEAWFRRLAEVGESLDLRLRIEGLSPLEVWRLASEGLPAATRFENGTDARWLIVRAVEGKRALLVEGSEVRRVSFQELQRELTESSPGKTRTWILGQPALPSFASNAAAVRAGERPLTPWRRLWRFLRPESRDLGVVLLFSVVVGILGLATPIAVESLVNTVSFGQVLQPVIILSILLFTFLAFAAALRVLMTITVEILQRRLFIRVTEDLAYRLPRVAHDAWDHHYGPELLNRFFEIATVQKVVSKLLLEGLSIVLQTLIGMLVLAFYHPYLLGFDVVLILLMTLVMWALGKGAVRSAIRESMSKYRLANWLQQIAHQPTAFKFHHGSQLALDQADYLATEYLENRRRHFSIVIGQVIFSHVLQALAATVLLGLGGWLVIQGELTLGQLVAAELIVTIITSSFAKIGRQLESIYDLAAAMDKLGHLFDLPMESHERQFHFRGSAPARLSIWDVELDAVEAHGGFRHDPAHVDSHPRAGKASGTATAISGTTAAQAEGAPPHTEALAWQEAIRLEVTPGDSLAIIGPSGSGKSTLMEMLAGLRFVKHGRLELDGMNYRELRPDSLREQIGLSRGIEIFVGDIAQNVDLNRHNVGPEGLRRALSMAGLYEEIQSLPEGLHTRLETEGAPLSKGQAAKLMVARAIAGSPRLLLIDGTLDGLSEGEAGDILSRLLDVDRSWTLVVSTTRRDIASRMNARLEFEKIKQGKLR